MFIHLNFQASIQEIISIAFDALLVSMNSMYVRYLSFHWSLNYYSLWRPLQWKKWESQVSTDLELLNLDVEEEVLVDEWATILLPVLQQVLVEEEDGQGQVTSGWLLQRLEELVFVFLGGLGSTGLQTDTEQSDSHQCKLTR